ncbi:MAG TPA: hypothetical protein VEU96_12125 [Bryobacteraceae bacterium]|nr:hypothetical protein [Bryobacteraceae bacterium]
MACPYFYPLARVETTSWVVPPRLPLGDPFAGECRAGDSAFQPGEDKVRQICNLGYGRGRCDRFPDAADADAVRFQVSTDGGELIRIQYSYEKDCWPREHGMIECSPAGGVVSSEPANAILRRQAAAFVESYVRRRA